MDIYHAIIWIITVNYLLIAYYLTVCQALCYTNMEAEAECYMHPLAELTLGEHCNRGTANTNHKG